MVMVMVTPVMVAVAVVVTPVHMVGVGVDARARRELGLFVARNSLLSACMMVRELVQRTEAKTSETTYNTVQ